MNLVRRSFHHTRSFFDRAFLLIFPGLFFIAAPLYAQSENISNPPACTRATTPRSSESSLPSGTIPQCPVGITDGSSTPANSVIATSPVTASAPVQPQTTLQNHRLFGVMANYTTVETSDRFGTLSAKTKFKLTAKTMTDPVTVSVLAGIALLGQARNSDPTYGQGFSGYDKRFATFYADTGIGTLMTSSVFPTALHQDPRYFQLGQGGFRRRLLHAAGSIFVARSDRGEVQFNYSQVAGNAVAAAISNTYHPATQRTLGNTLNVWGTDTLLNMFCNVAKEFWPDLRSKLHHQQPN
jgi:hypothetical protein